MVSGLVGTLFCCLFFGLVSSSGDDAPNRVYDILGPSFFGLAAAPAAMLTWPRKSYRSAWRMALAGSLTVLLGFIVIGFVMGLAMLLSEFGADPLSEQLLGVMGLTAVVVMFGSILTLGIPYFIGALLSVLFAEDRARS